jgi:hypothetical protein
MSNTSPVPMINQLSNEGATVFNFYNLIDKELKEGRIRDAMGLFPDPTDFIANIELLLKNGAKPLSVAEIVDSKTTLSNTFTLMACDGYALPKEFMDFIRSNGIPLSHSIPMDLVGKNKPSWTNRIEIALEEALGHSPEGVTFRLADREFSYSDAQSGKDVRNVLKTLAGDDADALVERVCEALSLATNHFIKQKFISNDIFDSKMTENQIRDLVTHGDEIISHGNSHTGKYPNWSADKIISDLLMAQQKSERITGIKPQLMTAPEGAMTKDVVKTIQGAEELALRGNFTIQAGILRPDTNRWMMPRHETKQENFSITADM